MGFQGEGVDGTFDAVTARDDFSELQRDVPGYLSSLAERREALVDGLLSAPGVRIEVGIGDAAEICGLDPLNVRHVPGNRIVHPAFVAVCAPDGTFSAQFGAPTVEDVEAGTFTVVTGSAGETEVLAAGEPLGRSRLLQGLRVEDLSLNAPGVSLEAGQAWVRWADRKLVVRLEASPPVGR